MTKEKSSRNKTIVLDKEEVKNFFNKTIKLETQKSPEEILNKTIYGDVFECANLLPDKFVDLLVVDPPYNLDKVFNGTNFKKTNDEEYREYTKSWIKSILHTLKDNASIYVCCDWKSSMVIGDVLQESFTIQNRITWQREKGRGAKSNWKNSMEDIWFATKSSEYTFNVEDVKMRRKVLAPYKLDGKARDWNEDENGKFRDTYPSNFWDDISIPYWSMAENTEHPTQKPEKLIAKLILASSNKGDVVFDPFLGSGTTSVVAKKLDRQYLGIDREKEYCALAEKRLEDAEVDKKIQGYTDGVFWERNSNAFQKRIDK